MTVHRTQLTRGRRVIALGYGGHARGTLLGCSLPLRVRIDSAPGRSPGWEERVYYTCSDLDYLILIENWQRAVLRPSKEYLDSTTVVGDTSTSEV